MEKIKELKELAEFFELENREIIGKYSDEELADIYNGIGPDTFPSWLREAISTLHQDLEVVAFIHDIEWHESDLSCSKFNRSNTRFKNNGYRVAKKLFAWYDPRRYLLMNQARYLGNICQLGGWSCWCANSIR